MFTSFRCSEFPGAILSWGISRGDFKGFPFPDDLFWSYEYEFVGISPVSWLEHGKPHLFDLASLCLLANEAMEVLFLTVFPFPSF